MMETYIHHHSNRDSNMSGQVAISIKKMTTKVYVAKMT